jgi:hypothetical protein
MTYQPRPERRPPEDDEEREPIFTQTDDDEVDDPIPTVVYWSIILLCVFETAAVFYGLYGMAWLIGQMFK